MQVDERRRKGRAKFKQQQGAAVRIQAHARRLLAQRRYRAILAIRDAALGRMLDPIADKLLVAACLLMLSADGTIQSWDLWAAIVILCREILVSGLREYLAELKVGVPVSRVAKWKTTLQLIAIGFLVAGPAGETILPGTIRIGIGLLWVAAALTLYTGYDYMRAGIRHVIDDPR